METYVEQMRSTGMDGPGYILTITEANEEYLLGIEGYDEYESEKTIALLSQYAQYDKMKCGKGIVQKIWNGSRFMPTTSLVRSM